MNKYRIWSIILILLTVFLGWFVYASQVKQTGFVSHFPFKLGLDLAGGTELTYGVDISEVPSSDVADQLSFLRDLIEKRVSVHQNVFGVSEAHVQIERAGTLSDTNKLIVDLPGVTDTEKAIATIGQTPTLEFDLINTNINIGSSTASSSLDNLTGSSTKSVTVSNASTTATTTASSTALTINPSDIYEPTGLTGRFLTHAQVEFPSQSLQPVVTLQFNSQGADLFAKITKENVGRQLAILINGEQISAPVINEQIIGGKAQISGDFTTKEAQALVKNLNGGALPTPINLLGTQTMGPSLGASATSAGIKAGLIGFALVALFLILWYRVPGVVATLALTMYIVLSLMVFKLIPITLTAAGIAGFILSIGMAVDANILIFERMKEELHRGKELDDAMHEGFHRAWLSIRDSNISSIITALALYFFLGTPSIKGFALTLGLGVIISMFTAITVSRTFLFALGRHRSGKVAHFLFGAGIITSYEK